MLFGMQVGTFRGPKKDESIDDYIKDSKLDFQSGPNAAGSMHGILSHIELVIARLRTATNSLSIYEAAMINQLQGSFTQLKGMNPEMDSLLGPKWNVPNAQQIAKDNNKLAEIFTIAFANEFNTINVVTNESTSKYDQLMKQFKSRSLSNDSSYINETLLKSAVPYILNNWWFKWFIHTHCGKCPYTARRYERFNRIVYFCTFRLKLEHARSDHMRTPKVMNIFEFLSSLHQLVNRNQIGGSYPIIVQWINQCSTTSNMHEFMARLTNALQNPSMVILIYHDHNANSMP